MSPNMSARERRSLLFAFIAAVFGVWPCLAAAQPQELPAKIATLGGRAELSRKSAPWAAAALRDELSAGDGVRTIAGRLTVRTASGQALRLGARTQIVFTAGDVPVTPGPTRVRMDGGLLWISVMPNSPLSTHIEVRAGPVTVAVRGGGATIGMNPDGSVVVAVYHGAVTVSGEGWQRALAQDQELLVPPVGAPKETGRLKREKRDAEWAKWNEQQDRAGGYGARIEK
jgi:ferric-dicitrate binding protein FerR (iron transport regulator)